MNKMDLEKRNKLFCTFNKEKIGPVGIEPTLET